MKKLKTLFSFSLFIFSFSLSFGQSWDWAQSATGSGGSGNPPILACDDSGNVFTTNQINGTLYFGPDSVENSRHGGIYTIKYNSMGSIKWLIQPVLSTGSSYTQGIATDLNGVVIIGGTF